MVRERRDLAPARRLDLHLGVLSVLRLEERTGLRRVLRLGVRLGRLLEALLVLRLAVRLVPRLVVLLVLRLVVRLDLRGLVVRLAPALVLRVQLVALRVDRRQVRGRIVRVRARQVGVLARRGVGFREREGRLWGLGCRRRETRSLC